MDTPSTLLGLELLVDDLDRAVTLFTDVVGWALVHRGASEAVVGEMAVVTDERVAITLLMPSDRGPGVVLADRTPRLAQLVFGAPADAIERGALSATELGFSVVPGAAGFFVSPESAAGALGQDVAVVLTSSQDA